MNRTESLKRALELAAQLEALVVEFRQITGLPPRVRGRFTGDESVMDSASELVTDAVNEWVEHNPPRTIEELRALPRWVQGYAFYLWIGEDPDKYQVAMWPNAWALEIIDRPETTTPEQAKLARTEIYDRFMAAQRCKECGAVTPGENFAFNADGPFNSPFNTPGTLFTCEKCYPPPDGVAHDDDLKFWRLVRVETKQTGRGLRRV